MTGRQASRERAYPIGAAVTLRTLDRDPHPVLAELRAHEPVSWVPALGGWLVTRYDDAVAVMRDAAGFTVADARFSTAQVVGPSMLSRDGQEHARHRSPFVAPFRRRAVREVFGTPVEAEAARVIDEMQPSGEGELRRGFAGPLAAAIVARALGLGEGEESTVLGWYDAIVGAVNAITAGEQAPSDGHAAFAALRRRLLASLGRDQPGSLLAGVAAHAGLTREEAVSNAAVLLFGGVETTEGMISNVLLHLLLRPELLASIRADPGAPDRGGLLASAIEESLRLEPAAALIDRYATAERSLRGAHVTTGDLVRVSIAGANRDPGLFSDPDRLDPARCNSRRHLAFAHGPHTCLGIHLARLEAQTALRLLICRLPRLRLNAERPAPVRGIVFRKPVAVHALWA